MRTITHTLKLRRALLALTATTASLMMVLTAVALPAQAQSTPSGTTITVNTDREGGFNDEYCSLREAVGAANTNQATVACPAGSATSEDTIVFGLSAYTNIELFSELSVTDPAGLVVGGGAQTPIVLSVHDNVIESRIFSVGSGAKLALRNLIVRDGHERDSRFGGAVVNRGTLEVTDSRFVDNSAGDGGAIINFGTLKVADSTFANNSAINSAGDGGAILSQGGTLEVSSSTFSGNSATSGGGIRNQGGTLTAVNTTFSGNSATSGGAIDNGGTLTATNSTFANNSATIGGGISNGGAGNTATLRSTILAGNASGGNCSGTIADGGHNVEDANACGFDQANNSRSGTDPKLETDANGNPALKFNGGPTQTIALLQDSPAKDAIPEGTNGCGTQITADQRGVKRPQGPGCEVGAFEQDIPGPPTAQDDSASTTEDNFLDIGVLGNDSDPNPTDTLSVQSVAQPAHGEATVSADKKKVRYRPDADFNGTDSFTYTVSDGNGGTDTGTVSISVGAVDDAPTATDDPYSVDEDGTLTVLEAQGVLANDSDTDGQSLTAVEVQGPAHGQLALAADGSFAYTPDEDFNGTDSFTYKASDGTLDSAAATVTITVTAVNDAPVAAPDEYAMDEDGTLTVLAAQGVLANDSDVEDGDGLSAALKSGPSNGSLTLNADGSFTYTPNADFEGEDSFTYTVSDGNDGTADATVKVTIVAVNDAPVARDDSASTTEDAATDIDVLANDTDVDDARADLSVSSFTQPSHGRVAQNPDGTLEYAPDKDYNGPDSFTYEAKDAAELGSGSAEVSIAVGAVNDAPTADADSYSATEDEILTALAPGVLANDSDPDGDKLSASLATRPRHGTLALRADGSFVYTPDKDYSGTDSFTYGASDGDAASQPATVRIAVGAASEPDPTPECTIKGTRGKDVLRGTARRDVICAYGGNDTVRGMGGNDLVMGGAGSDTIQGNEGDDTIYGGDGKDTIQGNEGDDTIYGGSSGDVMQGNDGRDKLYGGSGDDTMQGGAGNDLLNGGSGKDVTQQ